jgi:hypothetical protein
MSAVSVPTVPENAVPAIAPHIKNINPKKHFLMDDICPNPRGSPKNVY